MAVNLAKSRRIHFVGESKVAPLPFSDMLSNDGSTTYYGHDVLPKGPISTLHHHQEEGSFGSYPSSSKRKAALKSPKCLILLQRDSRAKYTYRVQTK